MALTIRTSEADESEIEALQKQLGIKTASGLLMHILHEWQSVTRSRDYWEKRCKEAERERDDLNTKIDIFKDALTRMIA